MSLLVVAPDPDVAAWCAEPIETGIPGFTLRLRFYGDLVLNSLNEAARRALEAMMKGYEYQSEFARKYVAQGEAMARARDVLTVLRVRGIAVSDALRERILAEKDLASLEGWLEKAATAASAADLMLEPS